MLLNGFLDWRSWTFDLLVLRALFLTLSVILLDTLLGWWTAWNKGEFSWDKAPQFLKTNVFPIVGALTLVALWGMWMKEIQALFAVFAAAANIHFIKQIKDKIMAILPSTKFEE